MFTESPNFLDDDNHNPIAVRAERVKKLATQLKEQIFTLIITKRYRKENEGVAQAFSDEMDSLFKEMLAFVWRSDLPPSNKTEYSWEMIQGYESLFKELQDRYGGFASPDVACEVVTMISELKTERDELRKEKEELHAQLKKARAERDNSAHVVIDLPTIDLP